MKDEDSKRRSVWFLHLPVQMNMHASLVDFKWSALKMCARHRRLAEFAKVPLFSLHTVDTPTVFSKVSW